MFKIYDGREQFYQWDLDRKLIVDDNTINEVHFCNRTDDCSLVCEVFEEDGLRLVNVPNILLQTDWKIRVYAYDSNYTKYCETFNVVARTKPADYVYTETEVLSWKELDERIAALEQGGGGGSTSSGSGVWLGSREEYEAALNKGEITPTMLCFIVDDETTTTGVIQNGNVLTILSDVVITQNNTELLIGA